MEKSKLKYSFPVKDKKIIKFRNLHDKDDCSALNPLTTTHPLTPGEQPDHFTNKRMLLLELCS